eukprot:8995818-Pyramimonas_sp.AAC.2
MNDAISSLVCAPQAVLPVHHFAALMLQMVPLGPVDRALECHRSVQLGFGVGDFGIHQVGGPRDLLADLVGATRYTSLSLVGRAASLRRPP